MPAAMNKPAHRQQQGAILLEGLIAILLFSMGILAIVGLQAAAIKTVADSQYRLQASFLANRLVAQMWANTADISSFVVPGGADADAWLQEVNSSLPGTESNEPKVEITGNATNGYQVKISVGCVTPVIVSGKECPETIQEREGEEGSASAIVSVSPGGATRVTFNGLGRVTENEDASNSITRIDVDVPTSLLADNQSNDLSILINGGSIFMCNPNKSGGPTACPPQ